MANSSLVTRTLQGLAWSLLGSGGRALFSTLVIVVLTRLLTPTEFGIVSAGLVIVSFADIFSQIGVGPAIVHTRNLTKDHVGTAFTITVGLSIIIGFCTALSASAIAAFFNMPELQSVLPILSLIFPMTSIGIVGRSLLQRNMQFKVLALIEFISYLLGYGLTGVLLAQSGMGVWALVGAHIGQAFVLSVLAVRFTQGGLSFGMNFGVAKQLLNFGFGLSLARIANYFATQSDNLVIGRFLGSEALGIYGRSYQFAMLPVNVFGALLDKVMFPAFAQVQQDRQRLGRASTNAVSSILMVAMPASAVLYVLAPGLVDVALGSEWTEVVTPFRILILVLAFRIGYKIFDSLARATGAVYRRAWRQWIYAAMVLIGTIAGQHFGAVYGVSIGVGLAVIANFFIMLRFATSLAAIDLYRIISALIRHAISAMCLGLLTDVVHNYIANTPLPDTIVLLLALTVPILIWLAVWSVHPQLLGSEAVVSKLYLRRLVQTGRSRASDAN